MGRGGRCIIPCALNINTTRADVLRTFHLSYSNYHDEGCFYCALPVSYEVLCNNNTSISVEFQRLRVTIHVSPNVPSHDGLLTRLERFQITVTAYHVKHRTWCQSTHRLEARGSLRDSLASLLGSTGSN